MTRIHTLKFLVDKDQAKRIKRDASSKGFISTSAYLRDIALSGRFLDQVSIRLYRLECLIKVLHDDIKNGKD